jgi:hypothetical protein
MISCAVVLTVGWFAITGASSASNDDFKIIVNRSNPAAEVTRRFVRDAFTRRTIRWRDGEAIRPIDLPKELPARDRFTKEVLGKTPASLSAYWLQRVFSGTDIPPPEAASPAEAIAYVVANPGAISYLPADVNPGEAKVIELR